MMPRTAMRQALQGDLVIFQTYAPAKMGIYLGTEIHRVLARRADQPLSGAVRGKRIPGMINRTVAKKQLLRT